MRAMSPATLLCIGLHVWLDCPQRACPQGALAGAQPHAERCCRGLRTSRQAARQAMRSKHVGKVQAAQAAEAAQAVRMAQAARMAEAAEAAQAAQEAQAAQAASLSRSGASRERAGAPSRRSRRLWPLHVGNKFVPAL